MRVAIHDSEGLIGLAELNASDPPMCVGSGRFIPTAAYSRSKHANVIDGEYVGDRTANLRVVSADHGDVDSEAISIQDFAALDEIVVYLVGISSPSYDVIFADDPSFRAYWTRDEA
jgi:hypothetical protein